MSRPLRSYLRTFRLRTGLSHDEVAFLIGVAHGTTVGKHERGVGIPSLKVGFGYSALYGMPLTELHAGMADEATRRVRDRAGRLLSMVQRRKGRRQRRKEVVLRRLGGEN